MIVGDFISQLYKQLGNGGAMYWNWYTDNLRPSQGYFVNGRVTPYCAEFVSCMLLWFNVPCIWFPNPCAFDSTCIPISERYYAQSIKRGDVISFDWDKDAGGDHVGFVTDVYDWGCHTIEGNTGPDLLVMERDRYWSDILFAIRPQYGEDDIVTEEDKRDIARMCAEYIYQPAEEDVKRNLNMYNATHWTYYDVLEANKKLNQIIEALKEKGIKL